MHLPNYFWHDGANLDTELLKITWGTDSYSVCQRTAACKSCSKSLSPRDKPTYRIS